MIPFKKILTYAAVYLACVGAIGAGVYTVITFYAQKTLYLDKKQWHHIYKVLTYSLIYQYNLRLTMMKNYLLILLRASLNGQEKRFHLRRT